MKLNDNLNGLGFNQFGQCLNLDCFSFKMGCLRFHCFWIRIQLVEETVKNAIRQSHWHYQKIKGHQILLQVIKVIENVQSKYIIKISSKVFLKGLIKKSHQQSHQKVSSKGLLKIIYQKVLSKSEIKKSHQQV